MNRQVIMARIGTQLRHARELAGIRLDAAAAHVDLSPQHLEDVEFGRVPIFAEDLVHLCGMYRYPPGAIVSPDPAELEDSDFQALEKASVKLADYCEQGIIQLASYLRLQAEMARRTVAGLK